MPIGKLKKEDLKEAGLDLDDLTTKLSSIPDDEKIKTIVTGSIQDTIKNSLSELEGRLSNQIKAATAPKGGDSGGGGNNGGGGGNNNEEISETDFMADPIAATRKVIRQQTVGLENYTLQLGADTAYNNAKNNFPYFRIEAIEQEVKVEWDKFPLQAKVTPAVLIKNIYDMVVGRHLDEIRTDTNKKEGKYNLVQPGGTSRIVTTESSSSKPEDSLTPAQLAAAKNFGMSPEEYAKFSTSPGVKYV